MKLHYPEGMKLHGDNACKYHGFTKYDWKTDRENPAMFWLYTEDDYLKLANHLGNKYVCWHNADVLALANNYAGKFINIVRNSDITHVCLNHITRAELAAMGIYAQLRYIFWGDPDKYTTQKEFTKDAYMCANPGRGIEYGESIFNTLAWQFPKWTFHIFGIDPLVQVYCDNVKYYGWIPEDEMDAITKNFALCVRYNRHDGFPQIMCKALLRGQGVITTIPYDHLTVCADTYDKLVDSVRFFYDNFDNNVPDLVRDTDIRKHINNWDFIEETGL
jgi:hypothetical protein